MPETYIPVIKDRSSIPIFLTQLKDPASGARSGPGRLQGSVRNSVNGHMVERERAACGTLTRAESDRERAVEGRSWNENVLPFLALLASYAGYDFDGTDWQAVEFALEATDDEHPDRWYGHPLLGSNHHLEVHLAQAVGGNEVSVHVAGASNPELLLRADTLIAAFAAPTDTAGPSRSC